MISATLGGIVLGCGEPPSAPESAVTEPTVPSLVVAPAGLTVKSTQPTKAVLAWSDGSSDETGFEVWRSTTGPTGSYTLRTTRAANTVGYTDTGLTEGTEYCYKVRAVKSGSSPSGFTSSACDTTTPNRPTNLAASPRSASMIRLSWRDNSAKEPGFELQRSTTGISGKYTLLATLPANATGHTDSGLTGGKEYCYRVRTTAAGAMAPSPFSNKICTTTPLVRVVTFGDSNTEGCPENSTAKRAYVSPVPRLGPNDPHLACMLAGKIEAKWRAARSEAFRAVNHGIGSTTSGGGGFGGPDRSVQTSPNARTAVNGITRYEAEVLGLGYPWSGGETTNKYFPSGPVLRVNAFVPGPNDFAYVSMGTNDASSTRNMTPAETETNLRWMVERWLAAGRAPDHFLVTTLPPRAGTNTPTAIPDRNQLIRVLAAELGVRLIDLAAHVSDDDGLTWRSATLHIGDSIHYTEAVRSWLADRVVEHISAEIPASP
jgi:lysophospholipase L1-like esterase